MVQAIQPFYGLSSGVWESIDMSWIPTENNGWRRVGRGSRGRRLATEDGMPESIEISYTETNQHYTMASRYA